MYFMKEFHILGHIVWCGILANVWQRWLAAVTVDSGGAATTAWSSEVCEQSWRRLTQEPAVSDSLQTILQRRRRKRVIFFGKFMKIISIITFTFPKLSRCVEINDLFWKSITLWVSFAYFSQLSVSGIHWLSELVSVTACNFTMFFVFYFSVFDLVSTVSFCK